MAVRASRPSGAARCSPASTPIFQRDYPNYTLKLFEDTTFPLMAMVRQKSWTSPFWPLQPAGRHPPCAARPSARSGSYWRRPRLLRPPSRRRRGAVRIPRGGPGAVFLRRFILSHAGAPPSGSRTKCLTQPGIEPNILCEINNFDAALRLVAEGLGVSIVLLSCARPPPGPLLFFRRAPELEDRGGLHRNHLSTARPARTF